MANDSKKLDQQGKEFACVLNLPKGWTSRLAFEQCLKKGSTSLGSLGYTFAYIIHDKDSDDLGIAKTLHAHIVVKGEKKCRIYTLMNTISDLFELPLNCISVDKVQNLTSALQYLIHKNDLDKYQYNFDNVISNLSNDMLLEYFNREKKDDISFALLWKYIVNDELDDVQIMARIGLNKFIQIYKCITTIRSSSRIGDIKYRQNIEKVNKEFQDVA